MGVGDSLYMYVVRCLVKKSSRSLSHFLMSSCLHYCYQRANKGNNALR